MSNFDKDTSAIRRKAGEGSILAFAKLYLPHHLKITPSKAHLEIYDLLLQANKEKSKKIAVAAPRDFGKSTTITLIYLIYLICYDKERFIVIVSNTANQAQRILENIRKELTENEELQRDFPEIFENAGRPKPPRWRQGDIITRNNIEILASGYSQKIRGSRYGVDRPGLVVLDDVEPDVGWPSSEMAEKMKQWLNKTILRLGSDNANYLFIGTAHHWLSVLGEYLKKDENTSWIKRTYQAIVKWPDRMDLWQKFFSIRNFKELYRDNTGPAYAARFYSDNRHAMDAGALLIWPEKWTLLQLMEAYCDNEFSFLGDMQNDPRNLSDMVFDVDNFHYWSDEYHTVDVLLRSLGSGVRFVGACDPATGKSIFSGDYSAIVVLACKDRCFYVIVADVARRSPDRLTRDIIAYNKNKSYPIEKFIIETNNFQELIAQSLEKAARQEGIEIPIERVNNAGNKTNRLFALYEWVKNGTIQFSRNDKILLDQFRVFPQQGKKDDGIDALEMCFRFAQKSQGFNQEAMRQVLRMLKDSPKAKKGIKWIIDPNTKRLRGFDDPFGLFKV